MIQTHAEKTDESPSPYFVRKRLLSGLIALSILMTLASVALPLIGNWQRRESLRNFSKPLEPLGAKAWLGSQGFGVTAQNPKTVTDETFDKWMPFLQDDRVVSLKLRGSSISDNSVNEMKEIPSLTAVDISNTAVTHEGVMSLQNCPKLYYLCVESSVLNEQAIDALRQCENLRRLVCRGPSVSDVTIENVGSIESLRHVEFADEAPSDVALSQMRRMNPDLDIVTQDGTYYLDESEEINGIRDDQKETQLRSDDSAPHAE